MREPDEVEREPEIRTVPVCENHVVSLPLGRCVFCRAENAERVRDNALEGVVDAHQLGKREGREGETQLLAEWAIEWIIDNVDDYIQTTDEDYEVDRDGLRRAATAAAIRRGEST